MSTSASRWHTLAARAADDLPITRDEAREIAGASAAEYLAVVDAASRLRRQHFGNRVHIHVLDNAKLGACPEDCGFCSQSAKVGSPSGEAPIKTPDELLEAAREAARSGAKRYCMVTATRGPSQSDLDVICEAATRIKSELKIELCASLGLLTEAKAKRLAVAGIDRFNHNLETSERHFNKIVSTHSWADRVRTIELAKQAGMATCCGGIVGLGESSEDLIDLAFSLRDLDVDSVPVNFLDPRPGTPFEGHKQLTSVEALLALCLFRFVHPRADLRIAGGREVVLRSLQPLALHVANSLFTSGYLTTGGNRPEQDWQMIRDAGFEIELPSGDVWTTDMQPQPRTHLPVA